MSSCFLALYLSSFTICSPCRLQAPKSDTKITAPQKLVSTCVCVYVFWGGVTSFSDQTLIDIISNKNYKVLSKRLSVKALYIMPFGSIKWWNLFLKWWVFKIVHTNKWVQQFGRIQYWQTKINSITIHSQWTIWKWD